MSWILDMNKTLSESQVEELCKKIISAVDEAFPDGYKRDLWIAVNDACDPFFKKYIDFGKEDWKRLYLQEPIE